MAVLECRVVRVEVNLCEIETGAAVPDQMLTWLSVNVV